MSDVGWDQPWVAPVGWLCSLPVCLGTKGVIHPDPIGVAVVSIKKHLAKIALREVLKVPGNDLFSRLAALSWAPAA